MTKANAMKQPRTDSEQKIYDDMIFEVDEIDFLIALFKKYKKYLPDLDKPLYEENGDDSDETN